MSMASVLSKLSSLVTPEEAAHATLEIEPKSGAGPKVKFEFQFNPASLTVKRAAKWEEDGESGDAAETLRFQRGDADELEFEAIFDETIKSSEGNLKMLMMQMFSPLTAMAQSLGLVSKYEKSVNRNIDLLVALTYPIVKVPPSGKTEYVRPPEVSFVWGEGTMFRGVVTSVTTKYELFATDGRPVRASSAISMKGLYNPSNWLDLSAVSLIGEGLAEAKVAKGKDVKQEKESLI